MDHIEMEQGDRHLDHNLHEINPMDDIDNHDIGIGDLLWYRIMRHKHNIVFVDLDDLEFFRYLESRLAADIGVIGFVSLEKFNLDYRAIDRQENGPSENVQFFINRNGDDNQDNMKYALKILGAHVDIRTRFVIISDNLQFFDGEAIRDQRMREIRILSPSFIRSQQTAVENLIN